MSQTKDRKHLIRLASTLPKGSAERRAILSGLTKLGGLTDKLYDSLRGKYRKFEMDIHKTLRAYMKGFEMALLQQDFVLDRRMSDISYWMDSEGIYPEGELYFVDKIETDYEPRDSIQVAKDLEKVGIDGSVWWQGNHWRVKFGGK